MQVRLCVARKGIHYPLSRYNNGQTYFEPGDQLHVSTMDYARLAKKGRIEAIDKDETEIELQEIDIKDVFPRKSNVIWVFGDGPSAMMAKGQVLPNAVTFAVNRCFFETKTDGTPALGLVPDYYVALDDATMLMEEKRIKELAAVRKFTNRSNSRSGKFTWPELRFVDVHGETGFSTEPMIVYHGKTTTYIALQLAVQMGLAYFPKENIEIHIAGVDLTVLDGDGKKLTHHYGHGNYNSQAFTRMLDAFRYGLNHLNELGIKWTNHSPFLAGRIEDLVQ